jgi:alpha-1,2-mannosyltransferase
MTAGIQKGTKHGTVAKGWLEPGRVRHYALLAVSILILVDLLLNYSASITAGRLPFDVYGQPVAGDLAAQMTAGRIALHGGLHHLYDVTYQSQVQRDLLGGSPREFSADPLSTATVTSCLNAGWPKACGFYNPFISPPVAAYLWAPLAALPYLTGAAVWTLVSLALLLVSLRLLWPLLPGLHRHGFMLLVLLGLSTQIAFELFVDGEDAALSLFLLVVGLRLLLARRDVAAGAVLGLGVFKPQLFLALPLLLLLQRRWRAFGAWIGVAAAMTLISVALVGPDGVRAYLHLLISPLYSQGIAGPLAWKMDSLLPLVRGLLPPHVGSLTPLVTALILVPVVVAFIRLAHRQADDKRAFILLYGLTILLTAVASPHLFVYDCAILVIPVAVLLDESPVRPAVSLSLLAIYALTWSAALRHTTLGAAPWPVSALAASWTAIPILVLFWVLRSALLNEQGPEGVALQPDRFLSPAAPPAASARD